MRKPGVTTILGFRPLPTLDAATFAEEMDGSAGEVVGFYRTTAAGIDSMSDEDKVLATKFFSHPSSVFLQVVTGASTIGDATFCFWGEGKIFDFPLMRFPFDAAELVAREGKRRLTRVLAPPRSSLDALEEVPLPGDENSLAGSGSAPDSVQDSKNLPVTKERASGRGWLVLALGTLLFASVVGGSILYFRPGSNPPVAAKSSVLPTETPSPLGLSVERKGNDLRVSWNGSADKIARADFGMLLIRGTAVSRDVPLTAEELRAGSVVYTSPSDQLRFQLTVVSGGQVAREFLTIVMPEPAAPQNRASLRTNAASVNPAAAQTARQPVSSGAEPSRKLREFKETRGPGSPAAPSGLDEPPPISGAGPANNVTPSLLNHPAVSPALPISSPAPPASSQAPPVSSQAQSDASAQRTRGGQASLSDSEAQPPVATRQVVPPVPALLRGMIWKPATVDVTVFVDGSGNVVKAEAVAKQGLHPLLREAAVQAALRWKFQPAQFNGHAVPANMVLQFNFAPNR